MPRNVRNFWLDLDVDGRKSAVETGPRSKDGGFTLRILVRDKGSVSHCALAIHGLVSEDGESLEISAVTRDGNVIKLDESQR